ncbi:MAG: hydroxymethylbilane synthase [Ignavibacteriae bacterium 37-53-5]|nr:MAG: hydroxymethylbilane synthase [Ignavibacteriae bacterium 37-53-5]
MEIQVIKTLGDKVLDSPLSSIGDKGLFTKEIEHALRDRTVDLAVHSLKDVPTGLPAGLTIGSIGEREDPRDAFIGHPSKPHQHFAQLSRGAVIATGSLRRKSQLLRHRPDFRIADIRGNLNTRLKKLEESSWDGMVLARAGVTRLGWESKITDVLSFDLMLPAVGQGALAIEIREDDNRVAKIVRALHHEPTAIAVLGERALLRFLEGGCQVPIGAHGRIEGDRFLLDAVIGSLDGTRAVRGSITGPPAEASKLGENLARQLLADGGREILDEIRAASA